MQDQLGNAITCASRAALAAYHRALDAQLHASPGVFEAIDDALAAAPDFALQRLLGPVTDYTPRGTPYMVLADNISLPWHHSPAPEYCGGAESRFQAHHGSGSKFSRARCDGRMAEKWRRSVVAKSASLRRSHSATLAACAARFAYLPLTISPKSERWHPSRGQSFNSNLACFINFPFRSSCQSCTDDFDDAANLKAAVIIQHDPRDIGKLPAFPAAAKWLIWN